MLRRVVPVTDSKSVRLFAQIQVVPRTVKVRPEPMARGVFVLRILFIIFHKECLPHEKHRKDHGTDRSPVQGPRLHLRRQRDLRRPGQHLGLRPPGRGAEEQRQEGLVEEVRPGEPLQRGSGLRHPHEPPGVGGLRPCGRLLRPPHGLQGVATAWTP